MTERLWIALALLALLNAATLGSCQSGDLPLIAELRWHAATISPRPAPSFVVVPHLTIPRLSAAPVIDGRLDDEVWQQAAHTQAWLDISGAAPARVQTQARAAQGVSRLFFALRCEEPAVSSLVATITEDGGPVWEDDCVELFFDPGLTRDSYRQIVINSRGAVTCLDPRDRTWRAAVERGVQVGDGEWTVELGVNIADLGITGPQFGLNLCRERRAGGQTELSCWSPTGHSFGVPSAFGLARLADCPLKGFDPGAVVVGLNQARVVMVNDGVAPKRLRARLHCWQGEELAREAYSFYQELDPGAEREVILPYTVSTASEPMQFEVAVLDQRGHTLVERSLTRPVRQPLATTLSQSLYLPGETGPGLATRLDVGPDLLQERGSLVIALFRQPGMALLARQELAPLQTPVLTARLSLPELPPGSYSLHVVLKQKTLDGTARVAETRHDLRVLPRLR